MRDRKVLLALTVLVALGFGATLSAATPTELFLRGYAVVPTPRQVELGKQDIVLDGSWALEAAGRPAQDTAVGSLTSDLDTFHGLKLGPAKGAKRLIRLSVREGAVKVESPLDPEIVPQGYRLSIKPDLIEVTGNGEPGLYYGVQTLIQLVKRDAQGRLLVPEAVIEDWPTYRLRFIHFDTKHHQDRMETIKRYLDWSGRFKINMIAFELEDKFEYPSHPSIGAPGAFTSAQLQEIVDYGLARHIQVVPNVQAPAHMAYVLKHPEFAHLKADGNNYQSCMCDEESYRLIFSMYDDIIKATKGVDFFLVSTDEVYYAGICSKCGEPYNPENRSLRWVEFVKRARDFMAERGRRMISWVEYPLLTKHVSMLPPDLINGVLGSDRPFIEAQTRIGMRQLIYTSMQGSEYLFPNYWATQSGDFRSREGRLVSAFDDLSNNGKLGNPIGVFGAAWGDSGLHNETFWLGWATVAQYAWTPGTPSVDQHVEEFMRTYYGPEAAGMVDIYRGLQDQTRFFQDSWDRVVSRARESGYGNSYGPGVGVIRRDETLPQPALPKLPGLDFAPVYTGKYDRIVGQAGELSDRGQMLISRIYENLSRVSRNRFNLEVLLSLARLTQHHDQMILAMDAIEGRLASARSAAESGQSRRAIESLIGAYRIADSTVNARKAMFQDLETTWSKGQFPKGQSVNGKTFLHVLDDTKDHWADRRADWSYMIAPEESIQLEQWMEQLSGVIRDYAGKHGIAIDSVVLEIEPEE